jgi:hypothetical protein
MPTLPSDLTTRVETPILKEVAASPSMRSVPELRCSLCAGAEVPMPTLPSCWSRMSSLALLAWMLTTGLVASVEVDLTTRVPAESPMPPMPIAPRVVMEETSTDAPRRVSWPVMVSPVFDTKLPPLPTSAQEPL